MTLHAVIVGAGPIGLATACRLAQVGAAVTVVDAVHGGGGASTRNAGWIVPIMSTPVPAPGMLGKALRWMLRKDSPLYVRPSPRPEHVRFMASMLRHCNHKDFRHGVEALVALNERTIALFDGYENDGVRFEYHRTGHLLVFTTLETMRAYQAETAPMERIGHTAIPLSGDEVRDLEPVISKNVRAGLHCSHERHLDPVTLIKGLEYRCRELGVEILYGRSVTDIRMEGAVARSLLAGGDDIPADVFVLAAGIHTGALARLAGFPLPIQPGKGYGLDDTTKSVNLRHAVYFGEAKVAVTPLSDRVRLAGTMEFGSRDATLDVDRLARHRAGRRQLPDRLSTAIATPCLDGIALDDARRATRHRAPARKGQRLVASGHCMLGVTLAPITAEIIAAYAKNGIQQAGIAQVVDPFSPRRFASRRIRAALHDAGKAAPWQGLRPTSR
jgi:D-amino-acid dehydrogenase